MHYAAFARADTPKQMVFMLHVVRCKQDEGFDPEGMVGTIKQLKLKSDKWPGDDGLWTANRPVFVQFVVRRRHLLTLRYIFC